MTGSPRPRHPRRARRAATSGREVAESAVGSFPAPERGAPGSGPVTDGSTEDSGVDNGVDNGVVSEGQDDPRASRPGPVASAPRPEDQTRDDTDEGWGERPGDADRDAWFESERPPHH